MKVVFNGAAQEVTGSCTLIETEKTRFLVDCGMFQGGREASDKNRNRFAFEPSDIDFVLLTHAHIDHSGLLPKLYREGFRGPIHTTTATAELLEIMLRDSAHIQETEAKRRAHRRRNRSKPLKEPIYTLPDAEAVLRQVRPLDYEERLQLQGGIDVRFRDAGHILGSAIVEIWVTEKGHSRKLVFSGDLGQPGRPILRDPAIVEEADILFIESTYGNRLHKNLTDTVDEFVDVVTETLQAKKGNVIIPAFAVGRTQELLYYFHQLVCEGRLGDLDIFVDSPMATAVTELTSRHMSLFDEQARRLARWHAKGENIPNLKFVGSVEESRALNAIRAGAIIIAASGMCTAGRIKYHLQENLPRPGSAILITGFQAQGTLGRKLVDGADQVRIFGQDVPVRASVHTLNGFSAHADQAALLDWLGGFKKTPSTTFVVHGEMSSSTAFAEEITNKLGWKTSIPERGQIEEIA
ncbi:MBL fold metallo-hydrolase RNA specificity domain-containing protein [Tritonibacter scottomollicae]|uniref:MBL fold metallo-hydrolase RNA specificity domain-containing protein n=1 Tax=Tritonibacter scottomollicae TaxID=483013 RepID=UPI003AA999BF